MTTRRRQVPLPQHEDDLQGGAARQAAAAEAAGGGDDHGGHRGQRAPEAEARHDSEVGGHAARDEPARPAQVAARGPPEGPDQAGGLPDAQGGAGGAAPREPGEPAAQRQRRRVYRETDGGLNVMAGVMGIAANAVTVDLICDKGKYVLFFMREVLLLHGRASATRSDRHRQQCSPSPPFNAARRRITTVHTQRARSMCE